MNNKAKHDHTEQKCRQIRDAVFGDVGFGQSLLESMPFPAMIIHKSRLMVAVNQMAIDYGVNVGSFCWDSFGKLASIPEDDKEFFLQHDKPPPGGTRCIFCQAEEALAANEEVIKQLDVDGTIWETHWKPVGQDCYLHFATDVTDKA